MAYDPEGMNCPKCGNECYRESCDVEVGIIYGPWGCPSCAWSESPEYDRSDGKISTEQIANPTYYVDQWGVMTPKTQIKDAFKRFGLDLDVYEDLFEHKRE